MGSCRSPWSSSTRCSSTSATTTPRRSHVQNIVEGAPHGSAARCWSSPPVRARSRQPPTLQKLIDRFAVQVALSDNDVETVVRQVVLRKKPEHVGRSQDGARRGQRGDRPASRRHSARRQGGRQATTSLPTTRCCRLAGDSGSGRSARSTRPVRPACCGPSSRSSTKPRAMWPTSRSGMSSAGTSSTTQQSPGMLQSGVLLKEIDELIRGLRRRGRRRRAQVPYLRAGVPDLPDPAQTDRAATPGMRATAPIIADLLVEDLADDGATLRKARPELLEELVDRGPAHADRRRVPAADRRGRGMGRRTTAAAVPSIRDDASAHEPAAERMARSKRSTRARLA